MQGHRNRLFTDLVRPSLFLLLSDLRGLYHDEALISHTLVIRGAQPRGLA